ncbi:MAG TPA: hypothetical protein VIQ31_25410, partial [Phormidium sp.]
MSYIPVGNVPNNGATSNAVFFGLKEDGTSGHYRWALQVSAENKLFQALLKAIGFEQEDPSSDAKWPIFIMKEGPIESFNPGEYGLEITKNQMGAVDLKVISLSRTEWPQPSNGFSKPKFSGTSFTENISTQPIEKTPVETSKKTRTESGFWFSHDNKSLEPGFNLAILLDETLSIGKSHTVDLTQEGLDKNLLRIYAEQVKIHTNTSSETTITTIIFDLAEVIYEEPVLRLERTIDHNFDLKYFYIAQNIIKFKLPAKNKLKIKFSLNSVGKNALEVYLPPLEQNAPEEPVSLIWIETCLMMKGEGSSLPLLVPTRFENNGAKGEEVLPPLKFSFKVKSSTINTEQITL